MRSHIISPSGQEWTLGRFRLGWIEFTEQALATRLLRDCRFGAIGVCPSGFASVDATIGETKQNVSLLVHRNIVKVEQVATRIVAAAIPNAGVALHWSIRSRQRSGPCRATIVGVGDPTVPGPFEVNVLVIAFGGGTEEDDCGPV